MAVFLYYWSGLTLRAAGNAFLRNKGNHFCQFICKLPWRLNALTGFINQPVVEVHCFQLVDSEKSDIGFIHLR